MLSRACRHLDVGSSLANKDYILQPQMLEQMEREQNCEAAEVFKPHFITYLS